MAAVNSGEMINVAQDNVGVDRANPIKAYEEELRTAWRWGCLIGSLHAFSQFVVFCNLTWATVALLGSFLPFLLPEDFTFVVCLLLLEAARLSSASFFTRLLRRALAFLSPDPKSMNPSQDKHYLRAEWARFSSPIVQFILTIPGVILSAIRLSSNLHPYNFVNARNVQKSLRIFYGSVLFNCLVALVNLGCASIAAFALRKKFPTEQSFLRYFDKVLENAMTFSVVQADDFEFLHFAYTMLASEFNRNVQPEAVAKNHTHLLRYLYAHRLGIEFLQIYLNAEDVFLQLVAANMVGFWADKAWGTGVQKLRLPGYLLTMLADKVGMGQVGWAASSSFGALALSSKEGVIAVERTCTSRGVSLLDHMADLVDTSSRSLSLVRTLVYVYEKSSHNPIMASDKRRDLEGKLWMLAAQASRHRLRVQAAYLLHLMNLGRPSSSVNMGTSDDDSIILQIDPLQDDYWFESEKRMLFALRMAINEPVHSLQFPDKMRDDRNNIAARPSPATDETTTTHPNRQATHTQSPTCFPCKIFSK